MPIPDSPAGAQPLMTQSAYAKRRGVSAMAVSLAIKSGRLAMSVVKDDRGVPKIADPDLADQEWDANSDYTDAPQHDRSGERASGERERDSDEPSDLADAAAEQKFWQSKLAQLKFRQAAKELIEASDVEERMSADYRSVRTKLLGLPSRARQQLPHLTLEDLTVLESLVREALEAIAADEP